MADSKELLNLRDILNDAMNKLPSSQRNQLTDEKILDAILNEKYPLWTDQKGISDELMGRQVRMDKGFPETKNLGSQVEQLKNIRDSLGLKTKIYTGGNTDNLDGVYGIQDPNKNMILLNDKELANQNQILKTGTHELGHATDTQDLLDGKKFSDLSYDEINKYNQGIDRNKMSLKKQRSQAENFLLSQGLDDTIKGSLDEFLRSLSPSQKSDFYSFRHHNPDNKVLDNLAGPNVKQMAEISERPFEKRALLNYIRKFGGTLKAIPGTAMTTGVASNLKGLNEASEDPNTTDFEKGLRMINTIMPDQNIEEQIEAEKKARDYLKA